MQKYYEKTYLWKVWSHIIKYKAWILIRIRKRSKSLKEVRYIKKVDFVSISYKVYGP